MNRTRAEKGYENYAWIIFVIAGLVTVYNAFIYLSTYASIGFSGSLQSSSPSTYRALVYVGTLTGLLFVGVAILIIAISLTSFKRGEKWSWYVFWIIPAFAISTLVLYQQVVGSVPYANLYLNIGLVALFVLGLVLPYRKFFPKKLASSAGPAQ